MTFQWLLARDFQKNFQKDYVANARTISTQSTEDARLTVPDLSTQSPKNAHLITVPDLVSSEHGYMAWCRALRDNRGQVGTMLQRLDDVLTEIHGGRKLFSVFGGVGTGEHGFRVLQIYQRVCIQQPLPSLTLCRLVMMRLMTFGNSSHWWKLLASFCPTTISIRYHVVFEPAPNVGSNSNIRGKRFWTSSAASLLPPTRTTASTKYLRCRFSYLRKRILKIEQLLTLPYRVHRGGEGRQERITIFRKHWIFIGSC